MIPNFRYLPILHPHHSRSGDIHFRTSRGHSQSISPVMHRGAPSRHHSVSRAKAIVHREMDIRECLQDACLQCPKSFRPVQLFARLARSVRHAVCGHQLD